MIKNKLTVLMSSLVATGALMSLTGCGTKYDAELVVYNWEDYIYEGTDETGKYVDDSLVEKFEKYYHEKTGKPACR